jgi:hypothetical protein
MMVLLLLALSSFGRVFSVTEVARREIGVGSAQVEVVVDKDGRALSRPKIARSEETRRQPTGGKGRSPGIASVTTPYPSGDTPFTPAFQAELQAPAKPCVDTPFTPACQAELQAAAKPYAETPFTPAFQAELQAPAKPYVDTPFTPAFQAELQAAAKPYVDTPFTPAFQAALKGKDGVAGVQGVLDAEMGTLGEDVWTLTDLQAQNTFPTDPSGCHIAIYDGPTSFSNGGVYRITEEWVEGHLGGPLNQTCGLFINNWLTRNPMHSNWATNLAENADITGPQPFGLVATYVGEFTDGSTTLAPLDVAAVQPDAGGRWCLGSLCISKGSSRAQTSFVVSLVAMLCIYYDKQ